MARKKIGDLLVERGIISQSQLDECLQEQATSGKRLGEVLVQQGFITEDQLIETIADRLSIPRVSLNMMVIDPAVISKIPVEAARRHTLIPIFSIGNTLTLAMADPLNIIAIDEIKYITGTDIKRAVATTTEIKEAINHYYSVADSIQGIMGSAYNNASTSKTDFDLNKSIAEVESPVVKLVNLIITKAVNAKASDIHIEPDETTLRIRYRINGAMKEEAAPSLSMQQEMLSRIKIAADMDVSEKRLPQDGRFMMNVDGNQIDLRVSTLPTIHGEKVVIRILDRRNLKLSFSELGFRDKMVVQWENIIHKPEGLILISGPTSSGKTSTLYTTLQEINNIDKNIITVEDPVEYSLPLINQIQINEKAGLTFPSTLRSMLRQNPDIIMIGEIRDLETAQMAVRSALTGHLVFSTIHTNDAPSAITRLIDMGVPHFLLASALKGVLAQRLLRVNCQNCLDSYEPSPEIIRRASLQEYVGVMNFQHSAGCTQCKNSGFKGQTGLFEFIEITPSISELIIRNASMSTIKQTASKQGYIPLFEAGLEKLSTGQVNLEELLKETSNIEEVYLNEEHSQSVTINA